MQAAKSQRSASRRAMRGVLHNFLDTFSSRYSDLDEYWLFGLLVERLTLVRFDLLDAGACAVDDVPTGRARQLAVAKFTQQVERGRLCLPIVSDATLVLERLPMLVRGAVNGRPCDGYLIKLMASARVHSGQEYCSEKTVFVAPHSAANELRSTRRL